MHNADTYTIVLNSDHAIIKQILNESNASTAEKLQPIRSEIKGLQAREAVLRQEQGKKKPEEVTQNEKDELKNTEDELTKQRNEKNSVIADYAKKQQCHTSANRPCSLAKRIAKRCCARQVY